MAVVQYPPTWTPSATPPPSAVPPTATRVLPITTPAVVTPNPNLKHLPTRPPDGIGVWLETEHLSSELVTDAAAITQLVTGPRALELKLKNRAALALARLDGGNVISATAVYTLDNRYAGVIVETGEVTDGDALLGASDRLDTLRAALGARLLIANTFAWTDGAAYFKHTSEAVALLGKVDGVCLCNFLRRTSTPLNGFKTEVEWKQDIDALAALSAKPDVVVLASMPFGKSDAGAAVNPAAWINYALGSFLLGVNNSHTFFNIQGENADHLVLTPIMTSKVGKPLGGYTRTAGVYERRFSQAIVLVNPSGETRTRLLTRRYKNANEQIIPRATLPPHSAMILFDVD